MLDGFLSSVAERLRTALPTESFYTGLLERGYEGIAVCVEGTDAAQCLSGCVYDVTLSLSARAVEETETEYLSTVHRLIAAASVLGCPDTHPKNTAPGTLTCLVTVRTEE